MKRRRFMASRAATASSPERAARPSSPRETEEFPLVIANMPATDRQKAVAIGVIIASLAAVAAIAPFARIQLGRIDAFIPVLQTVISLADLVTAILLFAQYSIQPQRALLALASGYLFSGSFAFIQTLAFPGGYAPNGLIGDGPNTPAWIYVFWHTTFPAAVLAYTLAKDSKADGPPGRPARTAIAITVAGVLAAIAVLTWIVTTKAQSLPSFYPNDLNEQTRLGNQANLALWLWGSVALIVLVFRRRTVLDLWLMVILIAYMPNFLVAMIGASVRYTVGWYAARGFVLAGSCMLLCVFLVETTFLYSRLANAIILQRRERTNRLLSVEAVTGAIAHELRTPLAAIALNAGSALGGLRAGRPPADIEDILADIEADSHRAGAIISSMRGITTQTVDHGARSRVEDAVRLVLRLMNHDLQISQISVATEFQENLPEVHLDGTQLQQVLLNLVKNAVEAMSSQPAEARRLRLRAGFDGRATVSLSVEDSGPGIAEEDRERIFDPLFTTKAGGMGLGLAICASVVENHGGKLRLVKSDSGGSVFDLAIPAVATDAPQRPAT
jgi:signal transduction histidine kinase